MAVTANQLLKVSEPGGRRSIPVAASTRIYSGTLVFAVAASGLGDDDTATGANAFFGVAAEEADNSSGSGGAIRCECFQRGVFYLKGSGFTQALVGDKIYASDNYTVTGTSTNNTLIGRCVDFVSATEIGVEIEVGTQA